MFAEIQKEYIEAEPRHQLPMVVNTVGNHINQQAIVRPNGSPCHHWIAVEEGALQFEVETEEFIVHAGQGVFCRAGVPHRYTPLESTKTCWVTFSGADGTLDYYGIGPMYRFEVDSAAIAEQRELDADCCRIGTVVSRASLGYKWLVSWLENASLKNIGLPVRIRRYLEAHYGEPLTLDSIAGEMHTARYTLCHAVSTHGDPPIMSQLRQIRIGKAKQFLKCTNLSAADIGRMCGFDSPSYFGKLFRESVGMSPGEYRNSNT